MVVATLAMFTAVLLLGRMATTPSLSLLYSGLESGPAGEVVRALDQRGVVYEVRGGAIFVEAGQRDSLRMTLASEGLPANSAMGYELLDGLSGFGTTSQMFDAAYWRAKEGELARTLVASPAIAAARVHIANTGTNPFQRDIRPSASVMLTSPAGDIPATLARASRFLVASAVPGLTPENVAVIDANGALVSHQGDTAPEAGQDLAEKLRERVSRLLMARVGPGNAVVELSVETVKKSELIRERRIDPQSRVAISTDTEERSNSANDQGGGDVTVASNLPEGDAGGGDSSSRQTSEMRERINYEVSQTERETTLAPGAIKRLSVAVLVNGTRAPGTDGAEGFTPRSEAELETLQQLVASAVGFDAERGDVITIKTMEFQPVGVTGTAAGPSLIDRLGLNLMSLLKAVVLAIVSLVLGLFVIRPILSAPPAALPLAPPDQSGDTPLTGEIEEPAPRTPPAIRDAAPARPSLPDGPDPVARLRGLIDERQEETVEILRNWLEGEEGRA